MTSFKAFGGGVEGWKASVAALEASGVPAADIVSLACVHNRHRLVIKNRRFKRKAGRRYWWVSLVGGNGEILSNSEMFTSRAAAVHNAGLQSLPVFDIEEQPRQ